MKYVMVQWLALLVCAGFTYLCYRLDIPDGCAFFLFVYVSATLIIQINAEKNRLASTNSVE